MLFCIRRVLAGGLMQEFLKIAGALALLACVLAGCSPATTFDGLSDEFGRLEADFAREPNPAETTSLNDPGVIGVQKLAYRHGAETALADRREINGLISKYSHAYNVPSSLVHRVVNRESTYNSNAQNGIHLGLMQLNPQTARTMGFKGPDAELLDADTNLKYGVKYLRGALMVAKGNHDRADKLYQTGYYYHAKRMGLLQATGLRP